ncbi:ATP synthase subunit b [Rickettsiales endosymbiont of Paramecium tredecaurelia]|uniref:hypothetical protein n=1 Tax=Candidatus Sarmatiella mevalonica TaxID=2770581 RepID=UPI001924130D|nr:hypothetical protein [Candidatus Sarmatiella mevalonica]MBL3284204.1 ATP synthase subunit b [Candidatus Sarmatiella mevalonica]
MHHIISENFIIALCFIAFIYALYRPVRKNFLGVLDKNIDDIKKKFEELEQLKNEAHTSLRRAEEGIGKLNAEKGSVLASARTQAKDMLERKTLELESFIERKKVDATLRFEASARASHEQFETQLKDIVSAAVVEYLKGAEVNASDLEIAQKLGFSSEPERKKKRVTN